MIINNVHVVNEICSRLKRSMYRTINECINYYLYIFKQAALLYNSRLQCGGTLISPLYVLTAGHCVLDGRKKSLMTLLLGRHNLASSAAEERGHQLRNVKEIYRHPSFSLDTFNFDFALLGK